jgi:hypothetical protein
MSSKFNPLKNISYTLQNTLKDLVIYIFSIFSNILYICSVNRIHILYLIFCNIRIHTIYTYISNAKMKQFLFRI